ncbi:hypothetical protein [Edwardsiella tarda]
MKTFNVKNVLIYRLTRDINLDAKAIEAALTPMAFSQQLRKESGK